MLSSTSSSSLKISQSLYPSLSLVPKGWWALSSSKSQARDVHYRASSSTDQRRTSPSHLPSFDSVASTKNKGKGNLAYSSLRRHRDERKNRSKRQQVSETGLLVLKPGQHETAHTVTFRSPLRERRRMGKAAPAFPQATKSLASPLIFWKHRGSSQSKY